MALLEGGAAVGVETFLGLASTWQKRGGPAIRALNPDNIDADLLYRLLTESDPRLSRYTAEQLKWQGSMKIPRDDFAAVGITSLEDVRDLFCTPFYWGCEADDPLVGLAFDSRITPLGAGSAFFASDLGHWDVPEFDEPLEEAYELVERKILREDEFGDFVFTNLGPLPTSVSAVTWRPPFSPARRAYPPGLPGWRHRLVVLQPVLL